MRISNFCRHGIGALLLLLSSTLLPQLWVQNAGAQVTGRPISAAGWVADPVDFGPQAAPVATHPATAGCGGSSCCGDSYCGEGCCNDCGPLLSCNMCPCNYGYVEGLIIDRNNRASNQPLALDLNTGDVLLSTGDLDFDWSGGLRAVVGHRLANGCALELGYLGIFDHSADGSVFLEDSLQAPGDLGAGAINNFAFADQFSADYESSLHSFEANLVACCADYGCCATRARSVEGFIGFRYLSFDEDFALTAFDSAEGTTTYGVHTDNDLYGGQLGARLRQCFGRLSFEGTGKAGLFVNDSSQYQDALVDFPDVVVRTARWSSDSDLAFVGELNFTGIYQLSSVWGIRAGYNLLWLEGVALAPDQLDFTNTPNSGLALVNDNGVFMHGFSGGLEARW